MKKSLFAASVGLAVIAIPAPAYTVTVEEEQLPATSTKNETVALLDALERKTEQLYAESEQQLRLHEEALKQAYRDRLRLTEEHVTFASRLVLKESSLLYNSRESGKSLQNATSLNLLTPSSITAHELDQFLAHTAMKGLGKAFVQTELETGVNAIFLAALAIHESGWGKSKIAKHKNNLYGYGAYDTSPYQSALSFASVTEGTTFVANKIKTNYLVSNGKYYAGTTLAGVNKRYSSDKKWATRIAATMNEIDLYVIKNQDTSYEVK